MSTRAGVEADDGRKGKNRIRACLGTSFEIRNQGTMNRAVLSIVDLDLVLGRPAHLSSLMGIKCGTKYEYSCLEEQPAGILMTALMLFFVAATSFSSIKEQRQPHLLAY
jgi:hypothetical protein